ncbi:hypothetical protein RDI58_007838 [Solanum bulbocastanum]|uniref:Uncharacterized protein n=1 Tax=Solanum bulbocastanum TaxID=147425 RepID=A0AAN8TVL3_SOLBU
MKPIIFVAENAAWLSEWTVIGKDGGIKRSSRRQTSQEAQSASQKASNSKEGSDERRIPWPRVLCEDTGGHEELH